jgi:hypothetical protein
MHELAAVPIRAKASLLVILANIRLIVKPADGQGVAGTRVR